jgi:hypothetical protein
VIKRRECQLVYWVVLCVAACGSMSGSPSAAVTKLQCDPVTTTSDASTPGCHPSETRQVCSVTGGATILDDGSVRGGTAKCSTQCPPNRFQLDCTVSLGSAGQIPSPDPALDCVPVSGPGPSNVDSYCCRCAK